MRNVAALVVWLQTTIVDTTVDVEAGTVYRFVAVVADGFDCPRTLYAVAIVFLLSYIPPSISAVGVGSVVMAPQLADEPSVVRYLPELLVCEGKAFTVPQEAALPLVVRYLPELLV
jgi:hypothetical protein